MAHDLRTPLMAISLAATALERSLAGLALDEDVIVMVRTLHRNVERLESLVDKVMKESAHVESDSGIKVECRDFDLWPLVEGLVRDLDPVAQAAGTVLINRVPEDLAIWADASLVRRMLQNLIANAIQSAPRGEVVIEAAPLADGGVECQVSDNGSGIPPERIATIFDKFETDREGDGGTGLGLSIVKAFAEAHGGTVTVESGVGVGSTFRFTLPGTHPRSLSEAARLQRSHNFRPQSRHLRGRALT